MFTAPLAIAASAISFTGFIWGAFGILYERWVSYQRYTIDEMDLDPPQDDMASIATVSVAKSEGDWFDEDGKPPVSKSPDTIPQPTRPETTAAPRLKHFAKKVSTQLLVLKRLNTTRPNQNELPSSNPEHRTLRSLKSAVHATVSQQNSLPKSAHHISSISIRKESGLVKFLQFSPNTHHLAVTW